MALYYLETSALVKLYVREPGTERLLQIASNASQNRLAVLALSVDEARSAIRRRQRAGDIDPKAAALVLDRLQYLMEGRFLAGQVMWCPSDEILSTQATIYITF